MPDVGFPIAQFDATRWVFGPLVILLGIMVITAGVNNIRTESATEHKKSRRVLNTLRGRSNEYSGQQAVRVGYGRVAAGIILLVGGIILMAFGAFLQ